MYICLCRGITEAQFRDIAARHDGSLEAVKREIRLDDSCCGQCEAHLEKLIEEVLRPVTS
jgi:bacterioferritin-associated ferredoxin